MKMKAVLWTRYGPPEVLQLSEVEKPAPRDNEVLIRIHATTVATGDTEIRRLDVAAWLWPLARLGFGVLRPRKRIMGQELAGEIESTGKDVKKFKTGDQVFARAGFGLGTYAEYTCLPEGGLIALKPSNMTYEEAAAVPLGGLEALHFIREANIKKGQRALINGAGGSIGTFAVQIAKAFGAEVIGVDSTTKMDMLRSIGADRVVDYTKQDFTRSGETYDVIFDVIGKASFSDCIGLLNDNGTYLSANPRLADRVRGSRASRRGGKRVVFGSAREEPGDLIYLKELIEAGKVRTVIDRRFPLEKIPEAHQYVETAHKMGNVVITLGCRESDLC